VNYTGGKAKLTNAANTSLSYSTRCIGSASTRRTPQQLQAQVPNLYGITDLLVNNLNGKTVQLYCLLRPMTHPTRRRLRAGNADSWYQAPQLKYEKRFSHGPVTMAHFAKMPTTFQRLSN
jgi:hypothetical protein